MSTTVVLANVTVFHAQSDCPVFWHYLVQEEPECPNLTFTGQDRKPLGLVRLGSRNTGLYLLLFNF